MSERTIIDEMHDEMVFMSRCLSVQAFALSEGAISELFDDVIDAGYELPLVNQGCKKLGLLIDQEERLDRQEVADALVFPPIKGCVWEFRTPIRSYSSPTGYSLSWSWSTGTWVYAETIEDAYQIASGWFQERDAAWRSKLEVSA